MKYYPVCLDIRGRLCLVVGGGSVGTRKVGTLLDCQARVKLVAPQVTKNLETYASQGLIEHKKRMYKPTDLDGVFLVIGASNNEVLNRQISKDAERLGKICNIADRPKVSNFILPSIIKKGDLTIAISTSGKSPAFAKKLRKDFENKFGNEYAQFLNLMGAVREKLLSKEHKPEAHKHIFNKLIDSNLLHLIKEKRIEDIDNVLHKILGKGFTWIALINKE